MMTAMRLTVSAGVVAMALAPAAAVGAYEAAKCVPKADPAAQGFLAEVGRHEAPAKVVAALRGMAPRRLSSALAYELLFHEHREAALLVLRELPAMKALEPALVHALQYGTNRERLPAIGLVQKWDVKAAIPVLLGDVLESTYVDQRERRDGDSPTHWRREIVVGVFSSACKALHALTDGKIGMHLRPSGATGSHESTKAKWRAWWKAQGPRLYGEVYRKTPGFASEKDVLSFCQEAIERWGPNVENRVRETLRKHAAECEAPPRPNRKHIRPEKLGSPRELWCESGVAVLLQEAVLAGRTPAAAGDAARSRQRLALLCLASTRPADARGVVSALEWLRRDGRAFDDVAWVEALRNKHSPATAALLGRVLGEVKDPKTLFQGTDVLSSLVCLETIPALVRMIGRVRDEGYDQTVADGLEGLMSRGPAHEEAIVKALVPLLSHSDDATSLVALRILGSTRHKPFIEAAITAVESAATKWTGKKKRAAEQQLISLQRKRTQESSVKERLREHALDQ